MRRLLRRAALLAGVAAITAWAWLGYGTTDSRLR